MPAAGSFSAKTLPPSRADTAVQKIVASTRRKMLFCFPGMGGGKRLRGSGTEAVPSGFAAFLIGGNQLDHL
jgi:hypothetical protein